MRSDEFVADTEFGTRFVTRHSICLATGELDWRRAGSEALRCPGTDRRLIEELRNIIECQRGAAGEQGAICHARQKAATKRLSRAWAARLLRHGALRFSGRWSRMKLLYGSVAIWQER